MENNLYLFDLLDNKGKSFEKIGNTYYLPHNSEFKILFHNTDSKRVNVKFILDGADVGQFRVGAHSNIKIERPTTKDKKFTFVSVNSIEGKQGRLDLAPKLGTIEIEVDPENKPIYYSVPLSFNSPRNLTRFSGGFDETDDCHFAVPASSLGGTVLGQASEQRFKYAEHMPTTGNIVKLFANMRVKTEIESLHQ